MDNLYSVIIQRPGKSRFVSAVYTTKEQAYALAGELAANMVDNKGYAYAGKMAGGTVIRLILNRQRVFIAIVEIETAAKS